MVARLRQMISALLIVAITGVATPFSAYAAMIGTNAAVASSDKNKISTYFNRSDVRAQLEAYGVSAENAKARIAALSDEEASQVASQIDSAPAGGDAGAVIGVIIIVALVLLLTDWLGYTHVYPFMKGHTRQ